MKAPTYIIIFNISFLMSIVEDSLNQMILIKREDDGGVVGGPADTTSVTPPEFTTVFPDSSSSQKSSSTMWEDIASSIKKLDPDHADVLLEATPASNNALPPVSAVVTAADYYHSPPHPQPQFSQ